MVAVAWPVLLFRGDDIAKLSLRFKHASLGLHHVSIPGLEVPRIRQNGIRSIHLGLCAISVSFARRICCVAVQGDVNHLILAW